MIDFSNFSYEKLLFANEQQMKNTARNHAIQDKVNNTRFNKFRDTNLGKLQPKASDYPYSYDIYNYKYGKAQTGSSCTAPIFGTPILIRPPNEYFNGYNSELLMTNKNRQVEVGARTFKNENLALPKPKIISS